MPLTLSPALLIAGLLACSLPALLAFNLPPSSTFFNQAAALAGWGLFAALVAASAWRSALRSAAPLLAALALLVGAALWSCTLGALPASLGASGVGMLLAIAAMAGSGAALRPEQRAVALEAFFWGWVGVGLLSAIVALVQVFAPDWADGTLVARSGFPGRAVGNLRQPNHLSTLLLWSLVALVPLREVGRLPTAVAAALGALFVAAIELSGSRTGTLGVLVLALWAVVEGRLSRPGRALLLGAPLFYAAWAWALKLTQPAAMGAATRLSEADLSSSRFAIWRNTLSMISQQPAGGVGFGEFNFAWTLTPFPDRPVAFFDHTHNIALQFAVELGLPLALAVLALMALALWQAWRRSAIAAPASAQDGRPDIGARAAFVMVLLVALHSQLEYPLWYAYFSLPAAWAWGACLGARSTDAAPAGRGGLVPRLPGLLLVLGAVLAVVDYGRVVPIFAPGPGAAALPERIAAGQRAWFFAHHADYAAATNAPDPADALPAFGRATHFLLDTRLMQAWAVALADAGDLERARHVAQRLREFHYPQSKSFFAPCDDAALAQEEADTPFQCEPPSLPLDWRDFAADEDGAAALAR